ncbi:MAG: hypothetical protein RIR73_1474, partial [Chloroflexota bacterium]
MSFEDGIRLALIGASIIAGCYLYVRFQNLAKGRAIPVFHPCTSWLLLAVFLGSVSIAFLFKSHIGLVNAGVSLLLLNQIRYVSIKTHHRGILNSLREGILIFDPFGKIQYVNPAAERLMGKTMEQIKSTDVLQIHSGLGRIVHSAIKTGTPKTGLIKLDGLFIWLQVVDGKAAANFGVEKDFILQLEDVTEYMARSKQGGEKTSILDEEIQELIYHDHLTDALNRRYFDKKMPELLMKSMAEKSPVSLLMIDVDQFKEINDEYGHQTGDLALKFVVNSMKRNSRKEDMAFRLGGDEFALVLVNTP